MKKKASGQLKLIKAVQEVDEETPQEARERVCWRKARIKNPITYEDVVVDFTQDEWSCLDGYQRVLYWEVMSETFKHLMSLGLITKLELERKQWCAEVPPPYGDFLLGGEKEEFKDQSWNLRKGNGIMDDKVSLVCRQTGPSSAPPESVDRTSEFLASCTGPPFICHTCGKSYIKLFNLRRHQFVHSSKQINKCTERGTLLDNSKALLYHKQVHLGERPFHCTLCDKTYCDASGLSRHRRVHMGYRPHPCPFCGKRFRDQSELKRHQKIHPIQEPVDGKQEHIVRIPSPKAEFQEHILRRQMSIQGLASGNHAPVTQYPETVFTTKSSLTQTQPSIGRKQVSVAKNQVISLRTQATINTTSKHVTDSKKPRNKAVCYETSSNFHKEKRSRLKLFSCPHCPLTFGNKSCFSNHQKVHLTDKSSSCFQCGKSFSSLFGLVRHQQTHWKQKIYRCPVCDVCFGEKDSLLSHWESYKGTNSFSKCWIILAQRLGFSGREDRGSV